ncbi:hypothetical protein [Nostoc sp. ChiQUE01b]|nr:hypothetical protein [Nostoc sp. ChiQUE01b]MDZ8264092.1 hypothetical protein [Nostoc sp. ChiQUE01b]
MSISYWCGLYPIEGNVHARYLIIATMPVTADKRYNDAATVLA